MIVLPSGIPPVLLVTNGGTPERLAYALSTHFPKDYDFSAYTDLPLDEFISIEFNDKYTIKIETYVKSISYDNSCYNILASLKAYTPEEFFRKFLVYLINYINYKEKDEYEEVIELVNRIGSIEKVRNLLSTIERIKKL